MESVIRDYLHFSNSTEGDFEGFNGFIGSIALKLCMGIDYMMNTQETHYDQMLVFGLTSCAIGLLGIFIFFMMSVQKYNTLFCKTACNKDRKPVWVDEKEEVKPPQVEEEVKAPKVMENVKQSQIEKYFLNATDTAHSLFPYHNGMKATKQNPRMQNRSVQVVRSLLSMRKRINKYKYLKDSEAPQDTEMNKNVYPPLNQTNTSPDHNEV
ncbi:uncharacterized protein LOC117147503 [Drosophila mauritiana]|uniref:Uncharacterized protein LOC117147503 n=1 Tax=Drosophila mauritiana TaxID=7226 RepID=A0A6P8KMN8_DROMA|nr:uncharacterized protein LOC117147503 [Drosophila mauritiana]